MPNDFIASQTCLILREGFWKREDSGDTEEFCMNNLRDILKIYTMSFFKA
jgi:hypothetical protein